MMSIQNFLLRRRATFDPPRFQGWGRRRNYFEGWYLKVVMAEQGLAYAFIPGISYDREGRGETFLQVLDGVAATSTYHTYEPEAFQPATDRFELRLGQHYFSADRLLVDLPELQVDLRLEGVLPWRTRPLAPGVMGWYGFVPRMQCYHGLVSYHHRCRGSIRAGARKYSITSGIGYMEKDWGSGFPDAWIWGQSNHLSGTDSPASLMVSVASIPWMGSSFTGFLCTLLLDGEYYLFTTWAGAQVLVDFSESNTTVELTFQNRQHRLIVVGHPKTGGDLASPVAGAMTGKINESLQATLEVRLETEGKTVYTGVAGWAGLEVSENARDSLV